MRPVVTGTVYCAHCGAEIGTETPTAERFGERFCSADHAERFVEAVRASRVTDAARRESSPGACHLPVGGQLPWKDRLKRSACRAAPLLVVVAIPLLWSGSSLAAAGGSALTLLAALACPLGMFFMMRAMMPQNRHAPGDGAKARDNAVQENPHA